MTPQKSLGDFSQEPKDQKPDLPPYYPPGFKFDCETCWLFRGYLFQKINGKEIRLSRCSFQTRIYEKHCRGRLWLDPDESKRYWIPKPLISEKEVKKWRLRDESRKNQKPGIPDEDSEENGWV